MDVFQEVTLFSAFLEVGPLGSEKCFEIRRSWDSDFVAYLPGVCLFF